MKKSFNSKILFVVSMFIFGTLSIFVKKINLTSGEIALYRAVLAAVVIGIYLLISKQKIKIDSVDTTDSLNITMRVDGRFDVILGGNSYMENKCKHLLAMIKNLEDDTEGTINLSMWTPDKKEGTIIRKNLQ